MWQEKKNIENEREVRRQLIESVWCFCDINYRLQNLRDLQADDNDVL